MLTITNIVVHNSSLYNSAIQNHFNSEEDFLSWIETSRRQNPFPEVGGVQQQAD